MIVDFGELEKAIKKVEEQLNGYNIVERELILNSVLNRLVTEKHEARTSQITDKVIKGMSLKGIMKKLKGDEE